MLNISINGRVFEDIQGIIFDKDGTLDDSRGYWAQIGVKRAELIERQIPGIAEHLLKVFGITSNPNRQTPTPNSQSSTFQLNSTGLMALGSRLENEIAAAAYIAETGRNWLESRAIARIAFLDADKQVKKTSQLFPDSLPVLKTCRERGLKLGIVSADTTANIEEFIRVHNLEPYIGVAIGSDRGIIKPDPALFFAACRVLEITPTRVLMIGDGQTDVEMGKKADAAGVIGVASPDITPENLGGADVIIERLKEIIANIYT